MQTLITVTRIIIYTGPEEVIKQTLKNGGVPADGTYEPSETFLITSSIISIHDLTDEAFSERQDIENWLEK